ncbi:MAG: hypothetical protein L0H93_08145, partial [Nocardioides sp.]|nr:hypothetical protein [Nocardioides sp.]
MHRRARRLLVGLTASLIAMGSLGTGVVQSASAAAGPNAAEAQQAAIWMAAQLDDSGTFPNPDLPAPDYGLMIDAVFAMHAAGRPELASPIMDNLGKPSDPGALNFWRYQGAGIETITVGALAKTTLAIEVSGRNPRDFAGVDHVHELEQSIRQADDGVAAPELFYNQTIEGGATTFSMGNGFDQAFGVIALSGVDRLPDTVTGAYVTHFQCPAGYWMITADLTGRTCAELIDSGTTPAPDRDATAMALSALLTARDSGAPGLGAA